MILPANLKVTLLVVGACLLGMWATVPELALAMTVLALRVAMVVAAILFTDGKK